MFKRLVGNKLKSISCVHRSLHIVPVDSPDVICRKEVYVKNTIIQENDSSHPFYVDIPAMIEHVDRIRNVLGFKGYRVDIWLCDDDTMKKYNNHWRGDELKAKEEQNAAAGHENRQEVIASGMYSDQEEYGDEGNRKGRKKPRNTVSRKKKPQSVGQRVGQRVGQGIIRLPSTDVLSFPHMDISCPGKPVTPLPINTQEIQIGPYLGDIIISPEYVYKQCMKDFKMDRDGYEYDFDDDEVGVSREMSRYYTVNERVPLLLIHSMIHLLGYDHEDMKTWKEMTIIEQSVIDRLILASRGEKL